MNRVVSCNLSWATQMNKVAGTEWEFVQHCQGRYPSLGGKECTRRLLDSIHRQSPDVVCFQEAVAPGGSGYESTEARVRKIFGRDYVTVQSMVHGSAVLVSAYRREAFYDGRDSLVKSSGLFASPPGDYRPYQIIGFPASKIVLINGHWPQGCGPERYKETFEVLGREAARLIGRVGSTPGVIPKVIPKEWRIIMAGDFNDHDNDLVRRGTTKVRVGGRSLSMTILVPGEFKTCCWTRDPSRRYRLTSDYVFDTFPNRAVVMPPFNEGSDHKAVLSISNPPRDVYTYTP